MKSTWATSQPLATDRALVDDETLRESEPFFIVGPARSGTTVMRLALNAHPRLAVPGETNFFLAVYERYPNPQDWPRAVAEFLTICETRLRPAIDLEPIRSALLARTQPDFRALLGLPLTQWAAQEGKPRWGEKTPEHMFYAEHIAKLFPRAKVIEMVRDPRAVVASMNRSVFKSSDSTRNAMYWRYTATTGHAAIARAMDPDRRMSVRYEDLVTEPERTLRAVCEFLEEDFDPGVLSFHERTATYLSASRANPDPKLSKPIEADLYGWREALSPRQLAITEAVCRRQMQALGYVVEGPRMAPSYHAEVLWKEAYVALKHFQQRDKAYHVISAPIATRAKRVLAAAKISRP
jgi:hypothetical protein